MKKMAVIGLSAALLLGAGCVRTLAPTVEDKDVVADASLAGDWFNQASPDQTLRIGAPGPDKHFKLEVTDEKGKTGRFDGKLGRIGELLVAEIAPEDLPEEWSDEYKGHFAPLFSFYVVLATKPALKIGAFDTDWLGPYIKAHPGELAASPVDDALVISPPEAVRAFLLKHWKDKDALSTAVFIRTQAVKKAG